MMPLNWNFDGFYFQNKNVQYKNYKILAINIVISKFIKTQYQCPLMGGISVILFKNHFFILLNKINLHTIIYNSLKFQTSITVVKLFIRPYVNLRAI